MPRLTSIQRVILENQRAIMLALLQHATAISTRSLRDRLEVTSAMTVVKKPKRKRKPVSYRGEDAFMNDIGDQGYPEMGMVEDLM